MYAEKKRSSRFSAKRSLNFMKIFCGKLNEKIWNRFWTILTMELGKKVKIKREKKSKKFEKYKKNVAKINF